MNGNVKIPPDFDLQKQNAASEWKFWRTAFEDYLVATEKNEAPEMSKLSILRNIIGTDSARIMATFCIPQEQEGKYDYMIECIEKYVNPRINECFERYSFMKRVQKEGENFEHFLTDCRHLVKSCNYNVNDPDESQEEKALRDRNPTTREALLRKDKLTLQKAIQFCRTSEQSQNQNLQFGNNQTEINLVRKKIKGPENKYKNSGSSKFRDKDNVSNKFLCRRCQTKHGPRECPAYGRKCKKCGIENHFAIACRVKNVRNTEIDSETDAGNKSSDSGNFYIGNVTTGKPDGFRDNEDTWEEHVQIENKICRVKLDTGADVNVMPNDKFKKLKCSHRIRKTGYVLKAFESTVSKPIGVVNLSIKYKNRVRFEDFVIIEGTDKILLGGRACLHLGLVKRVNNVNINLDKNVGKFVKENLEIFRGAGRLPRKCQIVTSREFEQVCHPPSKIPLEIRQPLKKELERLVDRDAIVKVDVIDSRASINRIVIVEKNNGQIRLCLDPTDLNSQIIRKPRAGETIEEIGAKFLDKRLFSVFDLSEGYHQIELDEDSSWKCCFATPCGIHRFKVLPYGLSSSQDIFQEEIERYFADIENVVICHDDMIIAAKDLEEHENTIAKVVKTAKRIGAKFNENKLQLRREKVKFMGQIFSKEGIQVGPDRVEALCKLKPPTNKVELQRMIGSFNYIRKYVQNMAEHLHPLCGLLKKDVEWQWLPKHQESLDKIKKIICESPALLPFDPKRKTILQCDASKNGLGCCMFQVHENNLLKLIACSSRTMNEYEVNYSQTEKELLAICFGTQKFHRFIYHKEVDVQTDHKPIISIMKKPISKIGSIRLQRLRLKLLKYSMNVYYIPGNKIHFADMLSRSSLKANVIDPEMFDMVHLVSKYLPMSEERKTELRNETSKDAILNKIYDYYYNGWPTQDKIPKSLATYSKLRNELYIEAGIIFLEDKIVVPQAMRKTMIELLHKGHIGVCKTINRARTLFYWPEMNTEIADFIKGCRICEKYSPKDYKEPMLPHSTPKLRFCKVGTDILEYGAEAYLIIIDHFSHWIEVRKLANKASEEVINAMQDTFTKLGFPQQIIADNLPFISVKCKRYFRTKDITVLTCTPHHHQSNGLAEKAVSIAKQILKKSHEEGTDYRDLILEYNNTPIIHLKAAPSQILHSRLLRSQIPTTTSKLEPVIQRNTYRYLNEQKIKVKEMYDKKSRKTPTHYKKGDKIVIRTSQDKIWSKATVLERAKEPRSYWVRKEENRQIVRRNTSQIKPSRTPSNIAGTLLEAELYPEECEDAYNRTHAPNENQRIRDTTSQYTTRCGRRIRPPQRLDL